MGRGAAKKQQPSPVTDSSIYSLADLFRNVNPSDKNFLKYIPDEFLSQEQIEAKRVAIREEQDRINSYPKKPTSHKAPEPSLGYHAGDLGKAESLGTMSGGRDTGHFGTGTYFTSSQDRLKGYNTRNGVAAPIEAVDFSQYNLFKPKSYEDGTALHEFLKGVNNYYDLEGGAITTREELDAVLREVEENRDLMYDDDVRVADAAVDKLLDIFANALGPYSVW